MTPLKQYIVNKKHHRLRRNIDFAPAEEYARLGLSAAFNLDSENGAVKGSISPTDVDGLQGEKFAVYEHFSGELQLLKAGEKLSVTLTSQNDFRLYILVPIVNGFAVP